MSKHPDDGKFVVVQDGKRVTGNLHGTQQEALTEADQQKKLRESQGQAAKAQPPVEVKQNLYG
jgi:hypothetical protein